MQLTLLCNCSKHPLKLRFNIVSMGLIRFTVRNRKFGRTRNAVGTQAIVLSQLIWVLPNYHKCFYNLKHSCELVLIFLKNTMRIKQENNLSSLIIKMYLLFALAIIFSATHVSSVFPSSYRNMPLKQLSPLPYFLWVINPDEESAKDF